MPWTRDEMPGIAASELPDGVCVNPGTGTPTLVANHLSAGVCVTLQSENGLLGMGPLPFEEDEDSDLINAGYPVGASGTRIVGTLARQLAASGAGVLGAAAICGGGGQGSAIVLESA